MEIPTVAEIERAIGAPAKKWEGRCYEIAIKILQRFDLDGVAVYGHWLGPIADGSFFYSRRAAPFVAHGWISLEDGRIIDPTRWVFENVEPYIFVGEPPDPFDHANEDGWPYDEGGNRWRLASLQPPPAWNEEDPPVKLEFKKPLVGSLVEILLQDDHRPITQGQAFWLANLPPVMFGPFAVDIYEALDAADLKAFVPIDNYDMIMREAAEA